MVFRKKKSTPFRHTNFYDAVANIYDEMALKIFIYTIAKPHVKRLRDIFYDKMVLIFFREHHCKASCKTIN